MKAALKLEEEMEMVDSIEPLKPQTYIREGICIVNGLVPVAVIKVAPYNKHEVLVYINENAINVDLFYDMASTGASNITEMAALLGLKYAIQKAEELGINSFEQLLELTLNQIINAFMVAQFISYIENVFDRGYAQVSPYRLTVYKEKVSLVDKEGVFKVCNSAVPFRLKSGKDEFYVVENRFAELTNALLINPTALASALLLAGINPAQLISDPSFLIKTATAMTKVVDLFERIEVRYF